MKIKIVKDNNPIMRKRSEVVNLPLSKEDRELIDEMLSYIKNSQDDEYAKKHNIRAGVGLAAVQVGVLKRMFVIYLKDENGIETIYQLVNPKIIENSIKKCAMESGEGCLSVDENHDGLVHRSYKIVMTGYDAYTNKDVTIKASGYQAVILQHEFDHLNGVLYYDHIDKLKPNQKLFNEEII